MDAADHAIVLAAVAGAHGVRGELRLKLFTDDLSAYPRLDAGGRTLTLQSIRPAPHGAVARFAEIADRAAAEALRGVTLAVPRSALPPLADGEYYHADLIGRAVVTRAGDAVGRVVAVEEFGAGDLIEVARDGAASLLVPVTAGVIELGPPIVVRAEFVDG